MHIFPNSYGSPVREYNTCHVPAGSPQGGQFCSTNTGGAAAAPSPAKTSQRPQPTPQVQREADDYNRARGLRPRQPGHYVDVDQPRAGRIADAYDALPEDDSQNPEVARAYMALASEIRLQWDHAIANGMRFEPWTEDGQPYQTSIEMVEDVRTNRRLYFYTGGNPHPFLDARDPNTGHTLNDMFRAIHDYYGHAAGGYGFGPRGEENAWLAHSQMFTWEARKALTTETRGQNSWVNFGRQNYAPDGTYLNIPPAKRPYATQKVALLPDEFVRMSNERKTTETKKQKPPRPFVRKPATLRPEDESAYRRPPERRK